MAYAVNHWFQGGSKEQYDAAHDVVHADGPPEGQLHHFAGEAEGGFVVFSVFDTEANWDKFRDETLLPGLQSLGDKGFGGPPREANFEVHNEEHGV
jgi:hypothetical protein